MSAARADESDPDAFLASLTVFEGRAVGAPTEGPDAVNQAMIRHWVEALGDRNPVYVDDVAARQEGFPGVIAPPTMLQAWTMRGLRASQHSDQARAVGNAPADAPGERGAR